MVAVTLVSIWFDMPVPVPYISCIYGIKKGDNHIEKGEQPIK